VEPAELALPVLVSAIRGGPSFFSTLAAGLVVAELGVVVATQNPVLSVVAGLPLLGGAALLSAVAGVLGDLKTGAALRPIKAAAAQGKWPQRGNTLLHVQLSYSQAEHDDCAADVNVVALQCCGAST
jgi:hypothetical protein